MIRRAARGAVSLMLYTLMAGGIATAVGSTASYFKGRADGTRAASAKAEADRARADRLHNQQLDRLRADAAARFDTAVREADERFERVDAARKEAQHALATEQAKISRLRGERDDAVRDRDRVRSAAVAAAASGGVTEAEDTVGACRSRADALGLVVDEALRAHRLCSLDLEEAGAGVRALRRWADAVEAGQRDQVAPAGAALGIETAAPAASPTKESS